MNKTKPRQGYTKVRIEMPPDGHLYTGEVNIEGKWKENEIIHRIIKCAHKSNNDLLPLPQKWEDITKFYSWDVVKEEDYPFKSTSAEWRIRIKFTDAGRNAYSTSQKHA